ncbi:glycosyl transferase family 2 [Algoriphagus boseongensis]|uniref:Glycosyl transferase family 2 n=1 Tax=Algoriphagus boseongensis TaxID=1442587 RepID=A0A4R6T4R5_9BACT|nr:glycosyltransferase [Algoriphagus boseongensis]TDQ13687.1 glycosyl transferase family 2 [Algoriphagus boseongensis]
MNFSIIICTYNGQNRLNQTLEGISNLIVPESSKLELLLIDNASSDQTGQFCLEYWKTNPLPFNYRLILEPRPGLLNARIAGIKQAEFPWIVFCDDDNTLFPDYLVRAKNLIEQFPEIGALGGQGIAQIEGPIPSWFNKHQSSFAVGPQAGSNGELARGRYLYGAGLIVKKSYLDSLVQQQIYFLTEGRKSEALTQGEDLEICYWISLLDGKLYYNQELKFYHRIEAHRLNETYLNNLKLAYNATEGLLHPYHYLLKHPNPSAFGFEISQFRVMGISLLLMAKYAIMTKIDSTLENSLKVNSVRFYSFFNSRKKSKQQFNVLQKMLLELRLGRV